MFKLSWSLFTGVFSVFVGSLLNVTAPMRFALQSIGTMMDYLLEECNNRSVWDIFAALLLLGKVERQVPKIRGNTSEPTAEAEEQQWQKDYFDRKPGAVRDVNRFVDYAVAIYNTWPPFIISSFNFFHPLIFLRSIFYLRPFYFLTRGPLSIFPLFFQRREIIGDSFFYHKTALFMASTPKGVKLSDLMFANFSNGVFQTPYCIVVDNVAEAIVVTIKGSTTIADFLTSANIMAKNFPNILMGKQFDDYPTKENDMAIVPEQKGVRLRRHATASYPFIRLNGRKIHTHSGMYLCARSMFGEIESQLISIIQSESKVEKYQIVITGHSLGAGVASLLALMFQNQWGDKVRSYSFAPPGCMISSDGLEEARKCILSFVLRDDIFPRSSYHSIKDLREDCHQIMQVQHNGLNLFDSLKPLVYTKFIFELLFWPLTIFVNIPHYVFVKYCHWSYGIDLEDKFAIRGPSRVLATEQEDTDDRALRLYPPGQLVHFTLDSDTSEVNQNWISHDDLQEFVLGWNIFADHLYMSVRRFIKRENQHFVITDLFPAPIHFPAEVIVTG